MQKAIFLLTQLGPQRWNGLYRYEPYNWGPYSRDLSVDLHRLEHANILRLSMAAGSPYGRYVLTSVGQQAASSAWLQLPDSERNYLRDVRKFVTHHDFNDLLREVYRAFPEYTTQSRWTGRR